MINHLPCNPGETGLIPGFTSLSDETLVAHLHMTLAVCGILTTNTHSLIYVDLGMAVDPAPHPREFWPL